MNLKRILNRTGKTITTQRAARLYKSGSRASDKYVEDLEVKKDKILDQIEDNMDVSANIDHNAGQCKISNEDIERRVIKNHQLKEELHLINQRLTVAKKENKELKATDKETSSDEA